jgi:MOSC domain-containing protein YiiM
MGTVKSIFLSSEANGAMIAKSSARLVPGRGIEGDRYFFGVGTFSKKLAGNPAREVTLMEVENVEAFNAQFGHCFQEQDFRRNIITQGIALNPLEGKEFLIGSVKLKGIRLCEPCAHLQQVLTEDVLPGLLSKGGLRAQILEGGDIRVGDVVFEQE